MTEQEKEREWQKLVAALQVWHPKAMKALLTALVLRHGKLTTIEDKVHTYVLENLTLEEIMHVADNYHIGLRTPEHGLVEVAAIPKEWASDPNRPYNEPPA